MTNIDALMASNFWWEDRKSKAAHDWVKKSVPLLFDTLDSLYMETRKLPLHSQSGITGKTVSKSYTFTLGIFLNPTDYATLRSILSLSGDVYGTLSPLKDMTSNELHELEIPIKTLFGYSDRFREIRNFYTHLGEAITNMDRHGVSGPLTTKSGLTYDATAQHCVHLQWEKNNTIYFTYNKKDYAIVIDKPVYDPIFRTAREIWKEITSHKLRPGQSANQYTPEKNLYPDVK
jgi:hypothetical protein